MSNTNLGLCSSAQFYLPNEIWENIFSRLPMVDLITTYSLVCKSWSEIIHNPYFLPWKKLYMSVKLKRESRKFLAALITSPRNETVSLKEFMNIVVEKHQLGNIEHFLINSICFLGNVHQIPESLENTCERLKHHRLFKLAHDFLNWIPNALISRPFNVWHITATIVIISEDVWDVQNLLNLLLCNGSQFTSPDVVEAFYSLATIFLHAARTINVPIRYHYMVYYTLYLFENTWQLIGSQRRVVLHNIAGQQPITNFITRQNDKPLTHEQAKVVNHSLQKDHIVKIVAFAGTGKTTTLLEFCRTRPQLKILLVVFNKSVEQCCKAVFPQNTKVCTVHAMAFRYVGRKYSSIQKLEAEIKPLKILDVVEKKENSGNRFRRAGLVKLTIERFVNTVDPVLTLQHVPLRDKNNVPLIDDYRLHVILDDAETVWKEMTRCSEHQRIKMSQDGQLKEWQLLKPQIRGYDVILLDEGQDLNAAMFDIFLNQNAAKIIVGDPFQQVYAFRGACNALQTISATHTFYLTQSFRFGPEIGFLGHCLLEKLLHVSRETLIGGCKRDTILADPNEEIEKMQRAYLCRTNLHLYKLALYLCKEEKYRSKSIGFAGDIDKLGLQDVIDIWKLSQMHKGFGTPDVLQITNIFIAKFKDVRTLTYYADNVEDTELMSKIMMYNFSGPNTLSDINLLKRRCKCEPKIANIVLSTIHKAKGLEWDWVILADDMFADGLSVAIHSNDEISREELNLLYVAVTRAKKRLTMNTAAIQALNFGREKLERLTATEELDENTLCQQCGFRCVDEDRKTRAPPLVTKVSSLPLSCFTNAFKFRGGFICDKCASIPRFEITQNPRRLVNPLSEEYVRDFDRMAKLPLITAFKEVAVPQGYDPYKVPIRWDKYHGFRMGGH